MALPAAGAAPPSFYHAGFAYILLHGGTAVHPMNEKDQESMESCIVYNAQCVIMLLQRLPSHWGPCGDNMHLIPLTQC